MQDQENPYGHERRKPLTDAELEWVKTQLLKSLYADFGQGVTRKILWLLGAVATSTLSTLIATGHIHIFGG